MRNLGFTFILFALIGDPTQVFAAEALRKNAISPETAGKVFASVCYDAYLVSVQEAQSKAQRLGYKYDSDSKLFVDARNDQQMRINKDRCALRYLIKNSDAKTHLKRFGDTATGAAKVSLPQRTNINIGTEDAGNSLTRVSVTFDQ